MTLGDYMEQMLRHAQSNQKTSHSGASPVDHSGQSSPKKPEKPKVHQVTEEIMTEANRLNVEAAKLRDQAARIQVQREALEALQAEIFNEAYLKQDRAKKMLLGLAPNNNPF